MTTSRLAIASLVLGILSLLSPILGWISLYVRAFGILIIILFFLGIISSFLAIILSLVALNRIRKDTTLEGKGMAIAGLVLGIVAVALYFYYIGALIFGVTSSRPSRGVSECPGRCYKANPPPEGVGLYSNQACLNSEARISGRFFPRNLPKTDNPTAWTCDECCVLKG